MCRLLTGWKTTESHGLLFFISTKNEIFSVLPDSSEAKSRLYFRRFNFFLSGMVSSLSQLELCPIFKSMSRVDCDSFLKGRD